MNVIGLDVGSNSVGSAWVDTETKQVTLGVSVFPAGVDEKDDKRGAPKNQARRQTRSQRRTLHRRAARKRRLLQFLVEHGLLPRDQGEVQRMFDLDPWQLRRKALSEPLSAFEFGRILVHMAQRRGAVGVESDPEDAEEGKVKEGMDRLNALMVERQAQTIGQLLGDLIDERRQTRDGVAWNEPIRNRQYRMPEEQMLFAGRELIRGEFHLIVDRQRQHGSALAALLTDGLVKQLDDPTQTHTWRHGGLLFGQRRTYWDTGTLGRCDLEPTERCAPIADRHASYFRAVETVNNIRIERRGQAPAPLTEDQRDKVIQLLRGPLGVHEKGKHAGKPKTSVSATDIRKTLGLGRPSKTSPVRLNIEGDEDREINTDWFHREIVHGVFGEARWESLPDQTKESVNRAILKFDPDESDDAEKLRRGGLKWWGLDEGAADRLAQAWKSRPKLEKRLNLSRRAICNLLPLMEKFEQRNNRWPTQQEARKAFAETLTDEHAKRRYKTAAPGLSAADRRYMRLEKHQIAEGIPELPPAPRELSNPVVRKAIHEVRRHIMAYLRRFGRKPDRVIIEMARVTKQSERQRNTALARNRDREKIRKAIIGEVLPMAFGKDATARLTLNQRRSAVDRVVLARQQKHTCPYCGNAGLTDQTAAKGDDLEVDHIVPYSVCGDNGLNNRVLVHTTCNRGKTNNTPRNWWGPEFDERIRFAEALFKDAKPDKEYFTKKDFARKWQNFNREVREGEEWKNSQLTDTAYAARQVAAYLADALYDGRGLPERGDGADGQKIFFTVGRFTSLLRRDWQLFETVKPRGGGNLTADEELELAQKDRGDHRQHAIDAVTIALTDPKIKNKLASEAAYAAEHKERTGRWAPRAPVPPPWGSPESFRRDVLSQVYDQVETEASPADDAPSRKLLVVAHRPVKRRLIGAFHEETHYGPVVGPLPTHRKEKAETLFTNRIGVDRLASNHLRVPECWDELSARLDDGQVPAGEKRAIRRQLAAMEDPSPGKSGIVRDRALRDRLRKCLRANGLDPDGVTPNEMKQLVKDGKLTMKSGVPVKGVVLLRTNTDPVIIPRQRWDARTGRMVADPDPRTARAYIGGNNHHVEIRQRSRRRKGQTATEWTGTVVSTFAAAKRLRPPKNADGTRGDARAAVDRTDNDDATFVMSLAEGEMIYARRKDRPDEKAGYFVVCKLDKSGNSCRIHFAPHWDARKASEQDRWSVTPNDLRVCGPNPGEPPYKVRVGALGDVRRLEKD